MKQASKLRKWQTPATCPRLRLAEFFRLAEVKGMAEQRQEWLASDLSFGECTATVDLDAGTVHIRGAVLDRPVDVVVSARRRVPSLPFWDGVCACGRGTRYLYAHPYEDRLGCRGCIPIRERQKAGKTMHDPEALRSKAIHAHPHERRWARQRLIDLGLRPRLPLRGSPCYSDRGVETMPAVTTEGKAEVGERFTRRAVRLAAEKGELYAIEAAIRAARLPDIDRAALLLFVQRTREHYPGADRKPKGGAPETPVEANGEGVAPAPLPPSPIPVQGPASAAEVTIDDPPEETDETPPPEPRVVKRGGGVRRKA